MSEPILIVDYDPAWPALAAAEMAAIRGALGEPEHAHASNWAA